MLEIYRSADASHDPPKIDTIENGSWIRMIQPTEDEITYVCTALSIPRDDIVTLLDDEENPRIEHDDGRTLIIVDTPYVDDSTDPEPPVPQKPPTSRATQLFHPVSSSCRISLLRSLFGKIRFSRSSSTAK